MGVRDARCYNCGARYPGLFGFAPVFRRLGEDLGFVNFTIGLCAVVYLACLLVGGIHNQGLLGFLGVSTESSFLFGAAGSVPVIRFRRWWTVLSAGWLHGSILHIFFNMYWLRILAPPVARLYGAGRMVIIYTVASVVGFSMSSLLPSLFQVFLGGLSRPILFVMGQAGFTLGASAALMGLLGAMVYYGRRGGSTQISHWAWGYAVLFFVFGLVLHGVDNWAHLGGFVGGYVTARILDPLKPERIDHLVAALVCIAASVIAIIASVITGLPYLSH